MFLDFDFPLMFTERLRRWSFRKDLQPTVTQVARLDRLIQLRTRKTRPMMGCLYVRTRRTLQKKIMFRGAELVLRVEDYRNSLRRACDLRLGLFGLNNAREWKGKVLAENCNFAVHYATAESLCGPNNGRKSEQEKASLGVIMRSTVRPHNCYAVHYAIA